MEPTYGLFRMTKDIHMPRMSKSYSEQLACLTRELALRRNTYRKWVAAGKMTQEKATHEIECMEAAIATVQKVKDLAEAYDEFLRENPFPAPTAT